MPISAPRVEASPGRKLLPWIDSGRLASRSTRRPRRGTSHPKPSPEPPAGESAARLTSVAKNSVTAIRRKKNSAAALLRKLSGRHALNSTHAKLRRSWNFRRNPRHHAGHIRHHVYCFPVWQQERKNYSHLMFQLDELLWNVQGSGPWKPLFCKTNWRSLEATWHLPQPSWFQFSNSRKTLKIPNFIPQVPLHFNFQICGILAQN